MKLHFFLAAFCIINTSSRAQTADSIPGEYYLEGIMETASGIQLRPDSSFNFFYTYGSLDRYGSGKWSFKEGQVILNSKRRPGADFRLVESKKVGDGYLTIRIVDKTTQILNHIECTIRYQKGLRQAMTNSGGVARFQAEKADSILLMLDLCPEKYTAFVVNPAKDYYEFTIEPWIGEVFFEEFALKWESNSLNGRHPLLSGNQFRYSKNN